ncbi:APC family permease [Mucilaginibacter terrae]|uniref:APA family basic amino acid/polyamine antiporter n=1 Tax=Mucilaginibacter terrae TaxID=1955052 RepID=A0ABU3GXR7_9SPHI|nr:amino acid permease [Mucilaginibacter terrae]MDT3404565.1 APA family basic amino acid/polyamine antiporter [Mucilaginibacter terrae]
MSIKPLLSRFDITMIVISLIIGTGIFKTPGEVALRTGTPELFFAAWIVGGIVTLCGALTFAEIGARYPTTGGFYKLFSYCYHPAFAFMINWVAIIATTASVAAVALIGAEYLNPLLLPQALQNATGTKITTTIMVLVVYFINLLGIKTSARTQNLLTIFKVGMIILLCMAIFMSDGKANITTVALPQGNAIASFGLALVAVFFTYTGYQQTINFGGDVVDAKSNMPKGIFIGIAVVIAVYMAVNFAYYSVLGMGGLQQNTGLAAKMASVVFGDVGSKVTSVLMFVSVLAYVNVNIMSVPRMYYAMAEDGILPAVFKNVNQRTQTQVFGMSFFVATVLGILLLVSSFGEVLNYAIFFECIGLSTAAIAIFILRKRTRELDGTGIYTIKWYPLVPIVFIVVYWFVIISIFMANPKAIMVCLAAFIAGLIIYYIVKPKQANATLSSH